MTMNKKYLLRGKKFNELVYSTSTNRLVFSLQDYNHRHTFDDGAVLLASKMDGTFWLLNKYGMFADFSTGIGTFCAVLTQAKVTLSGIRATTNKCPECGCTMSTMKWDEKTGKKVTE